MYLKINPILIRQKLIRSKQSQQTIPVPGEGYAIKIKL